MRTTTDPPTMLHIHGVTLYKYRYLDEAAVSTMFQQLRDPRYNMWRLKWTTYWQSSEPDGSVFTESDVMYEHVIAPDFVFAMDIWERLSMDSGADLRVNKVKSFNIRFVLEKRHATSSCERLLDIDSEIEGDDSDE